MTEQNGFITVTVTTAGGAFPVSGAEVMISNDSGGADTALYRFVTDESGQTPPSSLPAPLLSNSLSSGQPDPGYTLYNVTVISDGYYPLVSLNIPVFPGIVSDQRMILIPYTASGNIGTDEYTPDLPPYAGSPENGYTEDNEIE